MEQYVEKVDNHFRLKEGRYFYIINGINRLTTLQVLSVVSQMEFKMTYLRKFHIMHRDGRSWRSKKFI